ncbi:transposase [Desulfurivibrio sp. D14AmB]|uniref:transposase n=1 Tax=Desulfurivibrio sp. D14AmB TaxID=3374370 RepID=UPI00376F2E5B
MPRHKRLDIPGAVHHVIVRGLNRQDIFLGDNDRNDFLVRLETGLSQTGCRCYAWALLPNHFHLLVRTGEQSLSSLMRKILSGYAIAFNRRHQRSGYLFQNRYKSVFCQEEKYFLELLRYIHLNPLRAGVVKDMGELEQYPWSGHAVLAGRTRRDWQVVVEVLARFSRTEQEAVSRYRQFVADGISLGRREELTGGGLRRSAGGWEGLRQLQRSGECCRGDERILGDGDFVNTVLQKAEEKLTRREQYRRQGWDLPRLVQEVCKLLAVSPEDLRKKGRANDISHAKGLICYLGYSRLGISGTELAGYFAMSRPSVSQAIQRGERVAREKAVNLLN